MAIGLFEIMVLVGLFFLILVVAVIGFVALRRQRSRLTMATSAGSASTAGLAAHSPAGDETIRWAKDEAAGIVRGRAQRARPGQGGGCYARRRSRRGRRGGAARRAELRDQRLEIERRELRLADREERLDADTRVLEEKAQHLEEVKANLKSQRKALADAELEQHQALERAAGLTREQAKAELVAAVEHDAKRQSVLAARDIERQAMREADSRARTIVVGAIQRLASEHLESVVWPLHLPVTT